jgi:uncharacterized membrane protein
MEDYNGRSSFGFEENLVAAASYFLIGPVVFFKERRSNFVRFHALQATLGFVALFAFWAAVKLIGALYVLKWAPGVLALVFVSLAMLKAYDGEEYKFPIIGRWAFQAVYDTDEVDDDDLEPPHEAVGRG